MSTTWFCHDPRISDDREHKVETRNPALIAASLQDPAGVDWSRVAKLADYCDEPVDVALAEGEKG